MSTWEKDTEERLDKLEKDNKRLEEHRILNNKTMTKYLNKKAEELSELKNKMKQYRQDEKRHIRMLLSVNQPHLQGHFEMRKEIKELKEQVKRNIRVVLADSSLKYTQLKEVLRETIILCRALAAKAMGDNAVDVEYIRMTATGNLLDKLGGEKRYVSGPAKKGIIYGSRVPEADTADSKPPRIICKIGVCVYDEPVEYCERYTCKCYNYEKENPSEQDAPKKVVASKVYLEVVADIIKNDKEKEPPSCKHKDAVRSSHPAYWYNCTHCGAHLNQRFEEVKSIEIKRDGCISCGWFDYGYCGNIEIIIHTDGGLCWKPKEKEPPVASSVSHTVKSLVIYEIKVIYNDGGIWRPNPKQYKLVEKTDLKRIFKMIWNPSSCWLGYYFELKEKYLREKDI